MVALVQKSHAKAAQADLSEWPTSSSSPSDNIQSRVNQIDFQPVIKKLGEKYSWSIKSAERACEQYKRFLILHYKFGRQYALVPSEEIDEIWHQHILFTQQYTTDCQKLFGRYLHHQPALKATAQMNKKKYLESFEMTQSLYRREFGEYIYEIRWVMLFKRFVAPFTTHRIALFVRKLVTKASGKLRRRKSSA